ncbi:cytochrome-c peroxidase [Acuticoccus sp. I52.16.1]|uniref:cytochrome-c peroxidase n=1 Tax=Acuticoccus sp. I52.16.1 TaxID=2928472 RepID=UPI001FCF928E|nr:cytochrome-c peroxidase [Acuticoccus sp. I52.16.1]UOM34358.1 cytochrome-c peroxidase [Acuticoccus sp. I52.16.1]
MKTTTSHIMLALVSAIVAVGVARATAGAEPRGETALPRAVVDADYRPVEAAAARLGQLLFYDPILSGNRNISCATCHHPRFGTSDGMALSLGEGGIGLGPDRVVDPDNVPEQRVPRNAQALFNLGAREFTVLFHDGRIEEDPSRPTGLRTPLGADMEAGFDSVLSAQTMFPVLSPDEMAGHYSESDVSRAVRLGRLAGAGGAWDIIAGRVAAIPRYAEMFRAAYPEIAAGRPIAFTDISNAVAAFVAFEWRSDDAPFDAVLRGERVATGAAARGQGLFYGAAGCAACHRGPFLTDHAFHAMGAPQIGPGKGARFERHRRDEGRMEVTGHPDDAYKFRTPSLRNVARTGPWGHAGAHDDLAAFLADHATPADALSHYDRTAARLPELPGASDWDALDDAAEVSLIRAAAVEGGVPLDGTDIAALIAFLETLSDPVALGGRLGIPAEVPSGLKVER